MSASNNTRNLIAACAAITVFGLAFGMTYPLLSLILESRGVSTGMIGINSAMMPIGILLFSSVIPIAAKRFGSRNLAVAAALATSVFILAYKVFDSLEAWFLIRLLQGMSISTLFVLSEAWIVGFAGSENRGKVVAIYASAKAPMLLMAVGAFAVFDAATLSLLPVYGVQNGLSITTSATALTALIIGNVVLQFPLGWLADKYPHRLVLAGCALATVLSIWHSWLTNLPGACVPFACRRSYCALSVS